jgi:hypothetical protein
MLAFALPNCKAEEEDGTAIETEAVAADMAALFCDAYTSCDCESGLTEASACVGAITPALASGISQGELLGLRYHEACLDRASAYISALGCRKDHEIEDDAELSQLLYDAQRCKLLAGDGNLGDPCTWAGEVGFMTLGDSCASGLVCADICIALPENIGDLCADFSVCPPNSACLDPNADGVLTCELPAAEGKKCNPHDWNGCAIDLVCDTEELECTEVPGPGDACPDGVCATDSYCDGMVCQEIPGEGDSCAMQGVCGDGLSCDPTMLVCISFPGDGEPCMFGQCAAGFVCGPEDTCIDTPAVACELPASVGFCLYQFDGLCDEPEGTGLCEEGTDAEDCLAVACPTQFNGICDEPEGTGTCPEGTDVDDCFGGETGFEDGGDLDGGTLDGGGECPWAGDGFCDEPEGTGDCPEGTDPLDCP